ncbi:hypothetical protein [Ruegeria sp. HKCCA4633]|uniref:hypothetical protein n=1 Tax=Ruegeria sp. HKCCA4633 TaxID=2682983 RepID=UPI001488408A|nr:hypothetical protein [Ruegeria sp. HKCCA4633]
MILILQPIFGGAVIILVAKSIECQLSAEVLAYYADTTKVSFPPILSNTELPNLGNFGLVVANSVKGEALS